MFTAYARCHGSSCRERFATRPLETNPFRGNKRSLNVLWPHFCPWYAVCYMGFGFVCPPFQRRETSSWGHHHYHHIMHDLKVQYKIRFGWQICWVGGCCTLPPDASEVFCLECSGPIGWCVCVPVGAVRDPATNEVIGPKRLLSSPRKEVALEHRKVRPQRLRVVQAVCRHQCVGTFGQTGPLDDNGPLDMRHFFPEVGICGDHELSLECNEDDTKTNSSLGLQLQHRALVNTALQCRAVIRISIIHFEAARHGGRQT